MNSRRGVPLWLSVACTIFPVVGAAQGPVSAEVIGIVEDMVGFEREGGEFRTELVRLVEHQFEARKREIQGRYDAAVVGMSDEERKRREDAISRFEEFIVKYPDHPEYTPDALFRLAELHFEKGYDDYLTSLERHDVEQEKFESGSLTEAPAEPRQDYRRTIELFNRLLGQWPNNRNADGAMYLKGYCLKEMGEDKPAQDLFVTLVETYPDSKFVAESWLRIGEYYFDYNDLPKAIAAYGKVLEKKDSPFFDKALYKLAWTHYRNDQYDDAIKRFKQLVEFSDERVAKGEKLGSDLRAEAVQYLAVSLQEEDWDGDGEPDADAGFGRALRYLTGEKPYETEVLKVVAQIYFDNAKYEQSIEATRFLLNKFPTHPDNPALNQNIIVALERLRRFDDAFAERDALARSYSEGSVWQEANRNNLEATRKADQLVEEALITAATYHHQRAQALKDEAKKGRAEAEQEALREYRLAAVAYENYLRKYPSSENAYELGFYYADCLFYSFRFGEAATQYTAMRDSTLGSKYTEVSGFYAVLAHEKLIQTQIAEGKLPSRPSLENRPLEAPPPPATVNTDGTEEIVRVTPEEIPAEVLHLIAVRESYVKLGLNDAEGENRQAKMAYKAGEVYYDYKNYDKAREWFTWVVEHHKSTQVAYFAGLNLIQSYRVERDWKNMQASAEKLAAAGVGSAEEQASLAGELKTLATGAAFKTAEALFKEGKFDAAAREYIALVDSAPDNKFADRALNNAAVAFEKERRFESATNTYQRIVQSYPQSEFASEALFRVAVNSERFFDFDRAVTSHLALVETYSESEHRPESLYNAAVLQEETQNYRQAAANFERYAEIFASREDAAVTFYRSAKNFEKLKDTKSALRVYDMFVRKYGTDPKNSALVVESLSRSADIYEVAENARSARGMWERVINEFNARGMQVGTAEAIHPAKAKFKIVEQEFAKYEVLKLSGSLANQGKTIKDMQTRIQNLQRMYAEVIDYKAFEWTLAAFFRLGHIYQIFAQSLYEAPVPPGFGDEEQDAYRTQLEDIAVPIEDEAVKRYQTAYEKAREFKVTNEWTKRILTALNKFKPSDYPLFKEERRATTQEDLTPARILTVGGGGV